MPIADMTLAHATLEDIFLALTADEVIEEEENPSPEVANEEDYIPMFAAQETPEEEPEETEESDE